MFACCAAAALLLSACSEGAEPSGIAPTSATSPGTSSATESSKALSRSPAPRLTSVDNFRDLAGAETYRTMDGASIRPSVIYRSNALTADDEDVRTLNTLGIAKVVDLRTSGEIEAKPDRVPEGAQYVRHNLFSDEADNVTAGGGLDISSAESVDRLMVDAYQKLVNTDSVRTEVGAAIRDIAQTEGPVIFHCTSGKDRAGWIAATILTIAGVHRETVMRDYMLTNEYSKATIGTKATAASESSGPEAGAAMRALYSVSPEYLEAAFEEVDAVFGSFDNYVKSGLGLDDHDVAVLRSKIVEA
ncbi:tyrosine-protein phosphatase [Rhodococcus sp. C26F]